MAYDFSEEQKRCFESELSPDGTGTTVLPGAVLTELVPRPHIVTNHKCGKACRENNFSYAATQVSFVITITNCILSLDVSSRQLTRML